MTLGDVIYEYRMKHNISMDKFSELSGISKGYISMLEKNQTQRGGEPSPSFEMYRNVAKTVGMDVDELIRTVEGKISLVLPAARNILPMPEMRKIPLVGTIACGAPILAAENIEDYVNIPKDMAGDFALTCKGDSMINARIFDGDIVYIRQQDTVENGEIAAVLIDGEATLKRVRLFDDHISLEPENPMYKPFVYWNEDMNTIRILGKAVAFTSAVR